MDIVLYALTVLLYGGLAVAGWRARRVGAARPLVASGSTSRRIPSSGKKKLSIQ